MPIIEIAAGIAGLLALLVAGTFLLPRRVAIERHATIHASPEDIIALAASNEGYQRFNPYRTTDPDLKIDLFGPASGKGSGFHFDGKEGKGSQTVAATAPDRVDYDIDLGAMGQPRQSLRATAQNGGSLVVWTLTADLGMNPVARVFGLFMDRMIGKTLDLGLSNLASAVAKA